MLLSALAASLAPTLATPASHAGEGNALTAFLRSRQAANGATGVLAPIRGARLRLQDAQGILENAGGDVTQALGLVRAASCNCYIFDALEGDSIETRASLLQQNLNFGDPCTFSIVSRNVTNLLPKSQSALKERTEAELDALIASFRVLDLHVDKLRLAPEDGTLRAQARQSLASTIEQTVAFEGALVECLAV